MSAVREHMPPAATPLSGGPRHGAPTPRGLWPLAVGAVLAVALGLRLWGIKQGLPYAYNIDENAHFVPKAIGLFGHGGNPHYFVNPPAFTYLLHAVLAVRFGGADGVFRAFATDPTSVWVVARLAVAALGTAAVGLLYVAGARLLDRRVGLLAAALMAVTFLPVFYSHLALNDVPALAPEALALVGVAGVLRRGRFTDYALAGVGLGVAVATKYTAGIALLPLLAAAAAAPDRGRALRGLAVAGAALVAAFVAANPWALLDHHEFIAGLRHQSSASGEAAGKLGLTQSNGILYYLWTLTWGLGWIPALAALGGAAALITRRRWALAAVLVPAPLLFIVFMGVQARFFGRWLMPALPMVCLLAAWGAVTAVETLRGRARALGWAVAAVALLGQGAVYAVHSDRVLSRDDTRNLTREWMVAHVPAGTKIVAEPGVSPDQWAQDPGRASRATGNGNRWNKFHTSRSVIGNKGQRLAHSRIVNVEDYERTTRPSLIGTYRRAGYCWVVSGSTQSGRAFAEPGKVPAAVAYYRALAAQSKVVYRASPFKPGAKPVKFNFDWSFDFYPLAYERPGPAMTVYRLRDCR